MLDLIISVVGKVLGFNGDQTTANRVAGAANWLALAPVGVWLYRHHEEVLTFHVDVGTLALAAGVAFLILEFNRRT